MLPLSFEFLPATVRDRSQFLLSVATNGLRVECKYSKTSVLFSDGFFANELATLLRVGIGMKL
jgi:hypothetical protein